MVDKFIAGRSVRQQVLCTLAKLHDTVDEAEDAIGLTVEAYLADERPAVQSGTSLHCPDLSEAIQHLTLQQSRDVLHKIFAKHPQEARTSFLEEVCGKHLTKEAFLSLALELLWLTNRDSRVTAGNAIYMNLATEIGMVLDAFQYPYRSKERGDVWGQLAIHLNSLSHPQFKVSKRSVRDRLTLLQT